MWVSLCRTSGSSLTARSGNLIRFSKPQFLPLGNGYVDACHPRVHVTCACLREVGGQVGVRG